MGRINVIELFIELSNFSFCASDFVCRLRQSKKMPHPIDVRDTDFDEARTTIPDEFKGAVRADELARAALELLVRSQISDCQIYVATSGVFAVSWKDGHDVSANALINLFRDKAPYNYGVVVWRWESQAENAFDFGVFRLKNTHHRLLVAKLPVVI